MSKKLQKIFKKIWWLKNSPYICSPFEKNGWFIDKTERDNEVKRKSLLILKKC